MLDAIRHHIYLALRGHGRVPLDVTTEMQEEDRALERRLEQLETKVRNLESRLLPTHLWATNDR